MKNTYSISDIDKALALEWAAEELEKQKFDLFLSSLLPILRTNITGLAVAKLAGIRKEFASGIILDCVMAAVQKA